MRKILIITIIFSNILFLTGCNKSNLTSDNSIKEEITVEENNTKDLESSEIIIEEKDTNEVEEKVEQKKVSQQTTTTKKSSLSNSKNNTKSNNETKTSANNNAKANNNQSVSKQETKKEETITTTKKKEIWEQLGMTEYHYYNEPMYNWEHVDFSVNTYGSEIKTRNACLEYGDKYQPYLDGKVSYNCSRVTSTSGKYLGEMFYTENLS